MTRNDRAGLVLLFMGLILAALGQFYFSCRREYVWDGALFWAAAILTLTLMVRRYMRDQRGVGQGRKIQPRWLSLLLEHPVRALMALGGSWLSIAVGWLARQRPSDASFVDLLILWMTSVGAFVLAFLPVPTTPVELVKNGQLRRWLRRHQTELVGLAGLLLVALVVRTYDLEHIPANLGGDEGTWAIEGLAMLKGGLANPFGTRWFSFPSMSFLVWGASMRIFGETVAGLRAVSGLIGTVSVLTTFLLAEEVWDRRIAWLSAFLLAVGHYHLHFSRLAVNNIADSLVVTGALYLLVRGLRSGASIFFALAGAVIGAGWYGYFGARLVGIVAGLYLMWRMMAEHRFAARHGHHLLVLLGAALVVVMPLLMHYVAHPEALTEGLDRVSIFASGWLAREQEITGRSALDLLGQQFWKSISAFNFTLDPTFWYRPGIPLLDSVSGVLFVFGLIWCTAHWRWPASALLLVWFWSALFTGWVITENPPSSQRLVILAPALALLVALGLDRLMLFCERVLGSSRSLMRGIAGVVLLMIVGLNLRHYFLVYTPSRVYGNPTAELTTHLARYLERQDDDKVVYFHGPPFVYWDFGTLRFMARDVPGMDVPPPGEGVPPEPDLERGARFVFHPARVDELESVRSRYPGGMERHVRSRSDDDLLYAMYEVSR